MENDKAPDSVPPLAHIDNAIPRYEPYSAQGNMSKYQVRGITYEVWLEKESYKQKGIASWYGKKFHGHLTSNGEIYDMYSMSAAHKNLPLPSYVKVTNLKNNKTVIVRVNDRGPFHSERIIDLSYAAAYKLDMLTSGTASVEVELVNPGNNQSQIESAFTPQKQFFIQLLATSYQDRAEALARDLTSQYRVPAFTKPGKSIHKLQMGPISDQQQAYQILNQLKSDKYPGAFMFSEPVNLKSI